VGRGSGWRIRVAGSFTPSQNHNPTAYTKQSHHNCLVRNAIDRARYFYRALSLCRAEHRAKPWSIYGSCQGKGCKGPQHAQSAPTVARATRGKAPENNCTQFYFRIMCSHRTAMRRPHCAILARGPGIPYCQFLAQGATGHIAGLGLCCALLRGMDAVIDK